MADSELEYFNQMKHLRDVNQTLRTHQLQVSTFRDDDFWVATVAGRFFRSRKSRHRALSYALEYLSGEYHHMHLTTPVD